MERRPTVRSGPSGTSLEAPGPTGTRRQPATAPGPRPWAVAAQLRREKVQRGQKIAGSPGMEQPSRSYPPWESHDEGRATTREREPMDDESESTDFRTFRSWRPGKFHNGVFDFETRRQLRKSLGNARTPPSGAVPPGHSSDTLFFRTSVGCGGWRHPIWFLVRIAISFPVLRPGTCGQREREH